MNERIKEIAEQAWDATAVSPDFGHPVSFAEKLSELIITECIKVVAETEFGYVDYRSQIEEGMRNACERRLKNHFGVEE